MSLMLSAATVMASAGDVSSTAAAVPPASPWAGMLPFAFVLLVFYFLVLRPQQRRMKTHQEMVAGLKRGDKILTAGGIHGTVVKADAEVVGVEIAEGVVVQVARATIAEMFSKEGAKEAGKALPGKKSKGSVANDN